MPHQNRLMASKVLPPTVTVGRCTSAVITK